MKKAVIMFLSLTLLLAGCVNVDTKMVFNTDKTIDASVCYAILRNAGASDEAIDSIIAGATEELDKNEIDYDVSTEEDAYRINVRIRFDNVNEMASSVAYNSLTLVPKFTTTLEDGKIAVSLSAGGDFEMNGTMTSESMGFDTFVTEAGLAPSAMSATLTVVMPDGTEQSWQMSGDEEAEVYFLAENIYNEASSIPWNMIGIVGGAVIIVGAAVIIVLKRGKKKESDDERA